jgi:hypothetical protein
MTFISSSEVGDDAQPVPALSSLAKWAPHTHGPGCHLWPTPMASMARAGWGVGRGGRQRASIETRVRHLIRETGGRLVSPPQVYEWLMGLPAEWSDVKHPRIRIARKRVTQ